MDNSQITAALNAAKKNNAQELTAIVKKLQEACNTERLDAEAAVGAYFTAVENSESAVEARVNSLTQRKAELEKQIATLQPTLVNAAVSGNPDEYAAAQAEVDELAMKVGSVTAQISLLTESVFPKNKKDFESASAAVDGYQQGCDEYAEQLRLIAEAAEAISRQWVEIANQAHHAISEDVARYEEMREHFFSPEKTIAEMIAKREKRRNFEAERKRLLEIQRTRFEKLGKETR